LAVVLIQAWRTTLAMAADVADDRTGDVANADTPDSAATPETSRTFVHGRAHEETTLGYTSIDMPVLRSAPISRGYAGCTAISGPAMRLAALNSCDG
jgi:hypothetical protein